MVITWLMALIFNKPKKKQTPTPPPVKRVSPYVYPGIK